MIPRKLMSVEQKETRLEDPINFTSSWYFYTGARVGEVLVRIGSSSVKLVHMFSLCCLLVGINSVGSIAIFLECLIIVLQILVCV